MYFVEGRIQRILEELNKLKYWYSERVEEIYVGYGEPLISKNLSGAEKEWMLYQPGTPWGRSGRGEYATFKFQIKIPPLLDNQKAVLRIKTNKSGWNALNPQMLVYVNGNEYQGVDTNHQEILLSKASREGEIYEVVVHAFSGLKRNYGWETEEEDVVLFVSLEGLDPVIEEFYYNIQAPFQVALKLDENNTDRIFILKTLNEAINKIDLRVPYSKEFYESIESANTYIQENLYSPSHSINAMVNCIGHAHIDVAWLWRFSHTRHKAARTFTTVLKLMDEYPHFYFFSSQPQLYEYVKEDHPSLYERIKQKIREGRWEAEGGMWVEADTNLPSGESLVRQFLYGKRFFEEEFGIESKILWLPDVFGYSAALPQIMKKAGIEYFMTAKLKNNEFNAFPYHTFIWEGIDGSQILAHICTYSPRGYNGTLEDAEIVSAWENYSQKHLDNEIIIPYGYGDGGGGPTREMIEIAERYKKGIPGSPLANTGKALDFFERLKERVLENRYLPKWRGELYYEFHRGTYTSMSRNKKFNRKAEFLYTTAELVSVLNSLLLGVSYPEEQINKGWKGILLNQFHDVLPGSSIKEVYEDTDEIYKQLFEGGSSILAQGIDNIAHNVHVPSPSLLVFNPLSWNRNDVVEFTYPCEKEVIYLKDGDKYHKAQKTSKDNTYVAYLEKVPSKGYSTYEIREENGESNCHAAREAMTVTEHHLENQYYKIALDEKGNFTSLYDKRAKREILKEGQKGNMLQIFEDKPRREDNWNLDIYYMEKGWEVENVKKMCVIENGPVRGILHIEKEFLNSSITQDIIIYREIPRIDFKTVIDWKEKDLVVKAAFPVQINCDHATYEIQYGHITRSCYWNTSWDIAKFEVPAHKWADVSESGYGVSLLNDCKYGYDIKEGCMRLTLLRCGTIPNPYADKEIHEFTYSLYPHLHGWAEGGTLLEAYHLNCPLIAKVITTPHSKGTLPSKLSFLEIDKENVITEVVKKAEDGNDVIIRLYEAYNQREEVKINFYNNIKSVKECNLIEKDTNNPDNPVEIISPNQIRFIINPFEIKTFKIEF